MAEEITVHQPHTWMKFVTHDGDRISGCTCQAWQLDSGKIKEGTVPDDLPPLHEDCPHRKNRNEIFYRYDDPR